MSYLDYGARMYDSRIGRWHSIDPLAEKYANQSTYHFSGNNPIKFIDLNGMAYTYNWSNGRYYDDFGNVAEWEEVLAWIQQLDNSISHFTGGYENEKNEEDTHRKKDDRTHKLIEKYNGVVKNVNDAVSLPIDLAKHFTGEEITILREAGKISRYVGYATLVGDAGLTIDALYNNRQWGWHAYDTTIDAIGMMGGVKGTVAAVAIDSTVNGVKYVSGAIHWINTVGQRMMIAKWFMWY